MLHRPKRAPNLRPVIPVRRDSRRGLDTGVSQGVGRASRAIAFETSQDKNQEPRTKNQEPNKFQVPKTKKTRRKLQPSFVSLSSPGSWSLFGSWLLELSVQMRAPWGGQDYLAASERWAAVRCKRRLRMRSARVGHSEDGPPQRQIPRANAYGPRRGEACLARFYRESVGRENVGEASLAPTSLSSTGKCGLPCGSRRIRGKHVSAIAEIVADQAAVFSAYAAFVDRGLGRFPRALP